VTATLVVTAAAALVPRVAPTAALVPRVAPTAAATAVL
jgi:hypothetical protein